MATRFDEILDAARRRVPAVGLDALRAQFAPGAAVRLVDVREVDEFRAGHIPGALHLPRGHLESRAAAVLPDRDATVFVYCASGVRAALAASTLLDLGFTDVTRVEPGFTHWRAQGLPVEVPRTIDAARYARHLRLPEIGAHGQSALLDARVLCVGAGGLGSPALLYLAAAGVGTLGVADGDVVEVSNLQRQVIHTTARIGVRKVESAETAIRALNGDVRVERIEARVTRENVDALVAGYDVVIDGTDNFSARYLLNDAAVRAKKPLVSGAVHRFEGQATTIVPSEGPCYRCLYPRAPAPGLAPACEEAGVLGVLPGIIGMIQATEAIKVILGIGRPLVGRLLVYDALAMRFREMRYARDAACAVCAR